jgi:hypothetical protein
MSLDVLRQARWFDRERASGYAKIIAVAYVPLLIIPYLYAIGAEPGVRPSVDFMSFWSAAVLAWRDPASAYDAAIQIAFQAQAFQSVGRYLPFLYPPPFLAVVAPLGWLSFPVAYPVFVAATYAVYLVGARRLLPIGIWPIAVFPALYINAVQGQTGALFTGLFVAASMLVGRRPWMAGLLFGCLIFKPQLGLLIPVALVAGGCWRTIAGAALSALGLLAGALVLFGPETYQAFLHNTAVVASLLQGKLDWGKVMSLYGAVRQAGGPAWLALAAQAALTLAATAVVILVWRRNANPLTRTAALAMGALLITPYVLDYDFVLLIAPLAWLARSGLQSGFRPWERLILAVVYLAPLVARQAAVAAGFNFMPLLLIGFAGLVAAKMLRAQPV